MTLQLIPGYNVRKAAQAAAFFALKSGGSINVLKLSKLLYLAERGSMSKYDEPMFYDDLVSMPDGPVASITLNLINGEIEEPTWQAFVARREGIDVRSQGGIELKHLDELSEADLAILEGLWAQFGGWDRWVLREWTHQPQNIPEWTNPRGSSLPIRHVDVFRALKKGQSEALAGDVEQYRKAMQQLDAGE